MEKQNTNNRKKKSLFLCIFLTVYPNCNGVATVQKAISRHDLHEILRLEVKNPFFLK